ncbi:MAG: alpha-amylase family glycosyl hydrolase, partial [Ignavibacteria bacterium]|nr:alpha-amylase family glycosyl hydrolase [Ignavibacteria bacterium]
NSIKNSFDFLKKKLSLSDLEILTKIYIKNFPTKLFLSSNLSEENFLDELTRVETQELFIRNLILIYLSNQNRAANDLKFLFDDEDLKNNSRYLEAIKILEEYFDRIRLSELKNKSLIEFLFEPILVSPDNLEGQLNFIKENWKELIPPEIVNEILKAIDLVKEEAKLFQKGFGPGETKVPTFSLEELLGFGDKFQASFYPVTPIEEEKFTPDIDWMPKVVLLAKNIYVWLYQLSKKYNREIKKLDQIPDEELDLLSLFGFNAIWLIGIWERSPASRKIKQLSGNPEALASAYSIYDYVIANDLGGEEAYQNLNQRAWQRGIRLACDIVPNHTGIYSKWIMEHPDYFIQTDYPPFPSYSFTGPNLSEHPDFQIRIEDKYWTRQDAAVVFQLIENKTGKVRYIYHGNDGTNMPWNDTAQLNFLKAEVREAVIRLIFDIAKKFSIIRLDAAMTLTQKHYQRLWFPVPGTGGAIPSRTDFSMSTDEFLQKYPKEFWREVVDRINVEKPDTLLLAEAFWLMEGYFVRTLGMHRVYNSAFMNMLKNEENAKYRDLISNTLEFNPEILKRYVNFLSNPDEETAINQFGDGDKYFGCAVMMVTMPGLPMFAHGQIEGFREKYGHEYYRAYYDESPNEYLIERHKREIFPLMKKRYLFSQVENFELYDFKNEYGEVIENVFAYSNRLNNEAALVFYNNSYSTYYGYIDYSHPKNYGSSENEAEKKLISKSLGEALGIKNSENHFYIFRETKSNLEFIKKGSDFYRDKFFIELKGYEYKVFIDFVELFDQTGEINEFYSSYQRNGLISVKDELIKFQLSKLVNEISKPFVKENFKKLFEENSQVELFIDELRNSTKILHNKLKLDKVRFEFELLTQIKSLLNINSYLTKIKNRKTKTKWLVDLLNKELSEESLYQIYYEIFIALVTKKLSDDLELDSKIKEIFLNELYSRLHIEEQKNKMLAEFFELVQTSFQINFDKEKLSFEKLLKKILNETLNKSFTQRFIDVHEYENQIFYSKEKFEELLRLISILTLNQLFIKKLTESDKNKILRLDEFQKFLKGISNFLNQTINISRNVAFKWNKLTEIFNIS